MRIKSFRELLHEAILILSALFLVSVVGNAWADSSLKNLPSECDPQTKTCNCENPEVGLGCIMMKLAMGEAHPRSEHASIRLKVFALDAALSVFTPESLYVVMGYTFKGIGQRLLTNGLPRDVIFTHPAGEPLQFTFEENSSLGVPTPGIHLALNERLQMVDVNGWATATDPTYYDLYPGDGQWNVTARTAPSNGRRVIQ